MKKNSVLIILAVVALLQNSCKKTPDSPPLDNPYTKSYSVTELKAIASCTGTCSKRINEGVLTGVVLADQVSGNFYKEIYVRDRQNTGGIHIDLKSSAYYFFVGDSIRLLLQGYDVGYNSSTGMLEIDSLDFEKHAVIFAHGDAPPPKDIDLSAVNYTNYLCDLVRINGVNFAPADTNKPYADVIGQASLNHTLVACAGQQVVVRTSNYANFAQERTPKGYGSIIGIATAYGTTNQLAIRKTSEVNMNGTGCVLYHKKDFNDNSMTSGGWSQQTVVDPGVTWYTSTFSGATFAKISGYYSSTNHNSENWLISPSVNLSASSNPVLTFETMANFSGNVLEVLVSTNYTSGSPSTATWVNLTGFNLSSTSYLLTQSGPVLLSAYKSSNTRIAFKYTSTTTGSKTYEVDNIVIKEN